MMNPVYYFSGMGNSLRAAQIIAEFTSFEGKQ